MNQIDFQEKLIWSKLANNRNLLQMSTYDGISFWWTADFLFNIFIRSITDRKKGHSSVFRRNKITTSLFGSRVGLTIFLIIEVCLFLFARLIMLFVYSTQKGKKHSKKNKPTVLVYSYDAGWMTTPNYTKGINRKADHLKDSVMESLQDDVFFLCTSSFRYRKVSLKINLEKSLFWEYSYNILNTYWSPKSWIKQVKAFKYFKNQWFAITADPEFKKLCQFQNTDLYEPIMNEFRYYFFFLFPLCSGWVETYSTLMKKNNVSLAFISNESGHSERSLIITAKKLNIPVLAMQHGVINPTNRGYIYSSKDINQHGSIESPYCILADKIAVFGSKIKELLTDRGNFPENMVEITGNPKFDKLFQMAEKFKDLNHFRRWMDLPEEKKILVWTTQTHWLSIEENLKNIEAVYSSLSELGDKIVLILKLHPNEDQNAPLYLKDSRIKPIILGSEVDILQVIYLSDILLTKDSMTAKEAIALQKPVIILNLSGNSDLIDCVKRGVARGVYKKEDLKHTITKLLKDDNDLACNREDYILTEFHIIDGQSAYRMAQLILSMISEKSNKKNIEINFLEQ